MTSSAPAPTPESSSSRRGFAIGAGVAALAVAGASAYWAFSGPPPASAATLQYAWVQLGSGTSASVRAILTPANASCPTITVDNKPAGTMTPRQRPTSGFDQIQVCEHALSKPASQVSIDIGAGPVQLPPPTGKSGEILVVGDTGCRLKGGQGQSCTKTGTTSNDWWGFPDLSKSAAAGQQPDMILHVGDYLYRESETSAGSGVCDPTDPAKGWIHCGDNWPTWEDDFFAAARNSGLLTRAPWIFVRGNHEGSTGGQNRAWRGYFLFFAQDPVPPGGETPGLIPAYRVQLNGVDIHVVDTSDEDKGNALTSFEQVKKNLTPGVPAWLTTHVPTCDLGGAYLKSGLEKESTLRWLHVGHIHRFQHLEAVPDLHQPETVTGGSGTELDTCSKSGGCAGQTATCSTSSADDCCYGEDSATPGPDYSYLTVTASPTEWKATLRDLSGTPMHTFNVSTK